MAIWTTHNFFNGPVHIPKMVRFVQILGNMDHLFIKTFTHAFEKWTGPSYTKWSILHKMWVIWTTLCYMDRSIFLKIEVVNIPKVFQMTK